MIASMITLRAGSHQALSRYVAAQLHNMFPDGGMDADAEKLNDLMPRALKRMHPILAAVRNFDPSCFNHFNSLQYSTFLYLLSNEHWRTGSQDPLAERLFCLNRALNGIDLFYTVQMPEVFFLSHGVGTVLGNASYGNGLVIFQNVTVGRVGDNRPTLGNNIVLFPGAVVTGKSIIGDNSVVAAATVVHGVHVPNNSVAIMQAGELIFRPRNHDFSSLYLRSPD
jgi:serine O-acetyltransferase